MLEGVQSVQGLAWVGVQDLGLSEQQLSLGFGALSDTHTVKIEPLSLLNPEAGSSDSQDPAAHLPRPPSWREVGTATETSVCCSTCPLAVHRGNSVRMQGLIS